VGVQVAVFKTEGMEGIEYFFVQAKNRNGNEQRATHKKVFLITRTLVPNSRSIGSHVGNVPHTHINWTKKARRETPPGFSKR
jgi:hypothetical protein